MKKKIVVMCMAILLILLVSGISYAANPVFKTTLSKKKLNNTEIEVEVSVSKLENIGNGFNAYSGELVFNSKELSLISLKGTNEWNTPTYNVEKAKDGKTKVVATSNQFVKNTGSIFVATFKNISGADLDSINIEFKNAEIAAKINGETIKINEIKDVTTGESASEKQASVIVDDNANAISLQPVIIGLTVLLIVVIILAVISKKKGGEQKWK